MNVVFAGTPTFALPTLQRLHTAGYSILAVYTQPDRPAGRGRKLTPSPIKEYALAHGLSVRQPLSLRGAEEESALAELRADVMVVVAYGLILPPAILATPRHGCINVHASLLPRWRGAAPIARAIEAGDGETGVTIMQMEAGLDTGPMLLRRPTPIQETDTAASLEQRLAEIGADALIHVLEQLKDGTANAVRQNEDGANYAAKLRKEEAVVDWQRPALELHRKVRALNPRPVATTVWRGQTIRLWDVAPLEPGAGDAETPGTVLSADATGIRVQTGTGILNIQRLQAPGGRSLPVREFLNGNPVRAGDRFGA